MADGPWTKYSAPAASGGGNAMPWEKYGGTTAEAAPVDQNAVPDLNSPQAQQQYEKFGQTGYYLTPAEAAQAGNDQRPMLEQLMHPVGGWSGTGRRIAASLGDQGRALGNMFGVGDRIAATVEGNGATYTDRLREQQAATAESMQRLGLLGKAQDAAGSTLGAAAVLPEALVGGGATLLGKVGYGMAGGAAVGAAGGAAQTPADASGSDMLNNAALGAGLGAVTGGAIPAVAHGIGAVLGPSVAGPGQDAIAAGQRQGINVPVIAGSDSPLVQLAGQGIGGTFVGGAVPQSLQKMGSDIGARVQGIAKEAGTPNIPNVMGGDLRAGVNDYIKTGSQVPVDAAYKARDAMVPQGATAQMPNTQQVLNTIAQDRAAAGETGLGSGMDAASTLAAQPGGAIPAGLQRAKSTVGQLQQTGPVSEGYDKGDLKRLFGGMAQDQNDFYAGISPQAQAQHQAANALFAKTKARNQELADKLLGPGKSDEQLFSTVAGAAQAGGRANVKLLMQVKGAVPEAHWNDFAASVINKLGLNNKGDFSPTIFLNNWQGKNGIADAGKNILFTPAHRDALNDLAAISRRYDNLSKIANNSKTGNVNSVLGFLTGVLHVPVAALTAAVGGNQMARMLARPATVKTVTGWSQAYGDFMKNGGQDAAQDLSKWTKNLSVTLATELGDARQAPAIEQKLLQMKPMAQADDGTAPN